MDHEDCGDLEISSSGASSERDVNDDISIAVPIPLPVCHRAEMAQLGPTTTSQLFRSYSSPTFAPVPPSSLIVRRPAVASRQLTSGPSGWARGTVPPRRPVAPWPVSADEPRKCVRGTVPDRRSVVSEDSFADGLGGWSPRTVPLELVSAGEPRGWAEGTVPRRRNVFPAAHHGDDNVAMGRYSDFSISRILGLAHDDDYKARRGQSTSSVMAPESYVTSPFSGKVLTFTPCTAHTTCLKSVR